MRVSGWLTPEEFWARIAEFDDQMRATAHVMPLYGLAGWTGMIQSGDWHWTNDLLTTVGLVFGDQRGGAPSCTSGPLWTIRDQ
jgi:hypothetical protein